MKVRPKRTFAWYLENGMFYLYLILIIFHVITWGIFGINYSGLNKTVGWLYDFEGAFNFFYYSYSMPIYFLGFLLLLILRKKTSITLSIFFIVFVVLLSILTSASYYLPLTYLKLFTFLIFVVLLTEALTNNRQKHQNLRR